MSKATSRNAPPRASAMIEALRGLGYSPAAAIADVIDNSIAAGASEVDVQFKWNGKQSAIVIADNGAGMDAPALDIAMRLGERSPLDHRSESDLGRFGLGLKTASFSQARRLTVASRRSGPISCLRWDLDVLRDDPKGEWTLLEGAADEFAAMLSPLEKIKAGTIVLWENMDRIVSAGNNGQAFPRTG